CYLHNAPFLKGKLALFYRLDCVSAVDAYQYDMDGVAQFVNEQCIIDETKQTTIQVMHRRYCIFTDEGGEQLGKKQFNERMEQFGYKKHKAGEWKWKGIDLIPMRGL
ncbi:unnamed protein product, partial [marine sediment metagenome]